MADVCAFLHTLPFASFDPLSLAELMHWRERAIDRAVLLGHIERK